MAHITFSLSQLRAALLSAAKEDVRYYLNGILVESNGNTTRMVGTNGHHLLAVDFRHGDNDCFVGSFILPREACEMIAKVKRWNIGVIEIESAVSTKCLSGTLRVGDTTVGYKSVEGVFPDYCRVITPWVGTHDDMKAAQFNPEYIATFAKIAKLFGSKNGQFILWARGDNAALVSFQSLPDRINATGVLMPVQTFKPGDNVGLPCTTQFSSKLTDAKTQCTQGESFGA